MQLFFFVIFCFFPHWVNSWFSSFCWNNLPFSFCGGRGKGGGRGEGGRREGGGKGGRGREGGKGEGGGEGGKEGGKGGGRKGGEETFRSVSCQMVTLSL